MRDEDRDLIARLRWFAETGDMKQWAGPGATVQDLSDAFRADVASILPLAERGAETVGAREAKAVVCETCGEVLERGMASHAVTDHDIDCDGTCRMCPVPVECGPTREADVLILPAKEVRP